MSLSVRVGTVPILWNNDDVPELTPPVEFERVIHEMAQAGFEGTELGTNYPRDPVQLRRVLGRSGMVLTGGYFCPTYTDRMTHQEVIAQAEKLCGFLAEAGAGYLVAADPIHPSRAAVAGRARPEHGQRYPEFSAFIDAIHQVAQVAKREGLQMVFHNHAGTYVETPAELDRFLAATDPIVGLCLDTGHCMFGGGDPVEVIRRHGKRLRYVHLKDLDPTVHARAVQDEVGFMDALRRRVFTETGNGRLDLKGVLQALSALDYRGWLVCEQDTHARSPLESATLSRSAIAKALSSLGSRAA